MSYLKRLPDWLREDETALTLNDETEEVKIKSYYDLLRQYVKQPLQLWAKYKKENATITQGNIAQNTETEFDITGCYPIMPYIEIQDYSCCTPPNAVTGPIVFDDGNTSTGENKYTLNLDIPANGKLQIFPNGDVKINGIGIQHIEGIKQKEENKTIAFGKITGSRKLLQKFTPSEYTEFIEIKLKGFVGFPNDNVLIEIWELKNGEPYKKKIDLEVTNDSISAYGKNIIIDVPVNMALGEEEHGLVIKREFDHNDQNYFSICAGETNVLGDLMVWDGISWVKTEQELYLIEKIPFKSGNYPTITNESNTLTIAYENCVLPTDDCQFDEEGHGVDIKYDFTKISLDTLYVRGMAYVAYPLKELRCYIGDTLIERAKWIKEKKQYCYLMKISAEDLPSGLINSLPFEFYAEIEWHYFDKKIQHGYPQNPNHENPIFWPNELLNRIAKDKGLFRRNYRADIQYYEYENTYPMGYPYLVEQDYCLEKRLLNEYVTFKEKSNEVFLYNDNVQLISLKSKKPYSYPIEIIVTEIDGDRFVEITSENEIREPIQETFLFENSKKLAWDINKDSELLVAELISVSEEVTLYEPVFLVPEGIYKRHGLIKSEIYGYTGKIPHIQDMVDYCSIWDKTCWDYDLWGGDLYSPSVFRVDIPYPLPSNFEILSSTDVAKLLSKSKALGTYGISAYSYEMSFHQKTKPKGNSFFEAPEGIISKDFSLVIDQKWGDKETLDFFIKATSQISERELGITRYNTITAKMDIFSAYVYSHFSEISLEDYLNNCQINTEASALGSNGYEKIAITGVYSISGVGTKGRYENINPSGWLYWQNAQGAASEGFAYTDVSPGVVNSDTAGEVWHDLPYTDGLAISNFNISNLPNNAIITGIKVRFSCNSINADVKGYARLRTDKGSSTKEFNVSGTGWAEHIIGGNQDTWTVRGLTGADMKKQSTDILFWFGKMPANSKMEFDWCEITLYYKILEGRFMTPSISPVTPPAGKTGTWGRLTHELLSPLPSGCEIYYDILAENYSFGVPNGDDTLYFGTPITQKAIQIFKPTTTQICGIGIMPKGVVGLPTDRISMSICSLDSDLKPEQIIQTSSVSSRKWLDNTDNELIFPFDLTNLSTTKSYGILLTRQTLNQNNYFEFEVSNANLYNNGRLRFLINPTTWQDHNYGNTDLCFKVYTPATLLSNKKAPVNLRDIPYTQIKIRGKMFSNNTNATPKVGKIKVDREVVNSE